MTKSKRAWLGSTARYLLVGLLIREILSFWTGHPFDFESWVRLGYHVFHGVNPYTALPPVLEPSLSFSHLSEPLFSIGYPPLWAYVSAGLFGLYRLAGSLGPSLYYFLLKQPAIAGDILLGYVLYKFIYGEGKPERAWWAMRFWMFSPLTIIISAVWGMFDALVMGLVLAALLSASRIKKFVGISTGIFLKGVPVVFLPVLRERSTVRTLAIWIVSLFSVGVLSVLPFVFMGWDVQAIVQNGLYQVSKFSEGFGAWYFLYFSYYVSSFSPLGIEVLVQMLAVAWIPVVGAVLILSILRSPKKSEGVVRWLLIVAFVFVLARISNHEQHVLYILPLMILDVALWHEDREKLFDLLWMVTLVYLVVNNTLLIRFLSPVADWSWPLDLWINNSYPTEPIRYVLKLVLGLVFAATAAQYLLNLLGRGTSEPYLLKAIRALLSWGVIGRSSRESDKRIL